MLTWLSLLREVKPSADSEMIQILTFDDLFTLLRHPTSRRGRREWGCTTFSLKFTFFRQNDAGSRAHYIVLGKVMIVNYLLKELGKILIIYRLIFLLVKIT